MSDVSLHLQTLIGVPEQDMSAAQVDSLNALAAIISQRSSTLPSTPEGMLVGKLMCRMCCNEWIAEYNPEDLSEQFCPRCQEVGFTYVKEIKGSSRNGG